MNPGKFTSDELYIVVARDGDNRRRPVTWRTTEAECAQYIAILDAQRLEADVRLKRWRDANQFARLACHDRSMGRYGGYGVRYPESHPSHANYSRFLIEFREFREQLRLTMLDPLVLGSPLDPDDDDLWYHEAYEIWRVPPDSWPPDWELAHQRALARQPIR